MANIEQYSPAYDSTRYIVIAVFSIFVLVAALIHLIFLPNDKPVKQLKKLPNGGNCDVAVDKTELMQKSRTDFEEEQQPSNKVSF